MEDNRLIAEFMGAYSEEIEPTKLKATYKAVVEFIKDLKE